MAKKGQDVVVLELKFQKRDMAKYAPLKNSNYKSILRINTLVVHESMDLRGFFFS